MATNPDAQRHCYMVNFKVGNHPHEGAMEEFYDAEVE